VAALRSSAAAAAAAVLSFAVAAVRLPLFAQEPAPPRTLVPGKGSDLTTARCATCHDAQHITRARLSRDEWEYNIRNMIERGAPIAPHEIPVILDYLATYYNRDNPPPPPDPSAAGYGLEAGADPAQRLLAAHACIACHHPDKRVVGPSYREIAGRFAGDSEALARLTKKVREGGAGVWGSVPMPPHPGIPESELTQMVSWILQQR
jgi:cytochrome c551/c552